MAQHKKCSRCGLDLPLEAFHRHNKSKDGHAHRCKACAREVANAWYKENREQRLERLRGDVSRNGHYQHKYKMSLDDYIFMAEAQEQICANPGCEEDASMQRNGVLVVDHDRSCCDGKRSCGECVRGLLCQNCNKALGLLKEDRKRIMGLIDYIEAYSLKGGD